MDTHEFSMWLHGYFEISESNTLSEKQVQIIKDHLDLCFNKVTPDRSKEEWVQPYFGDKEFAIKVGKSLEESVAPKTADFMYKWDSSKSLESAVIC